MRPHTSILSMSYSRFTIRVVEAKKKQNKQRNKQKKKITEIYFPLSNATQLSNAPLGVWPCLLLNFDYFQNSKTYHVK